MREGHHKLLREKLGFLNVYEEEVIIRKLWPRKIKMRMKLRTNNKF